MNSDHPPHPPEDITHDPRGALEQLANLPRRIYLTYTYHGMRSVVFRALTFPLRFTPLRGHVQFMPRGLNERGIARAWYRRSGRPVTIIIPSYRDAPKVANLVRSIRRTTRPDRVRIIVPDDASGAQHVSALRQISGIEIIEGERNAGFAANVNRGLRARDPAHDVIVLNSDTIVRRGWLASLQYATSRPEAASWADRIGIVGAKLLYGHDLIQSAGTVRKRDDPEWFDHRYRFQPPDSGPANLPRPVLAVTGACMYITREVLEQIGEFDESYPMAYEDVDFCLRAWQAGYAVLYWPAAEIYHLESVTRGTNVTDRERASQHVFWTRWGDFFDARNVRTDDGALRVIYVTEDTGVGGGHRDIFEHLNGLLERGHEVELWTLAGKPDWFDLHAPVRTFADYGELVRALRPVEAIKVATWWNTALPVWLASVLHGIPAYFVQDIETSYYPSDAAARHAVIASYREEFHYMTISEWNREKLRRLGLDAELIPPGIDLENFQPLSDVERRSDVILTLGRSNPLKNLPLTISAWRLLPEPRPQLWLFGIEPDVARGLSGARYIESPTDAEVNRLLNEATVFVQTSRHEGFCLPALEAMATGCAVVCTDAHGNRDYCVDGQNCLMPDAGARAVADALGRLLSDARLRESLGQAGIGTAADYAWPRRIDALERFFTELATPHRLPGFTGAVPVLRRTGAR